MLAGCALIALTSWSVVANADPVASGTAAPPTPAAAITDSNNQIAVDFLGYDFGYTEYAALAVPGTPVGGKLDTEGGWVPGVNASVSLMRNWIVDNAYFNAQFSYNGGSTKYTGETGRGGGYGAVVTSDTAKVFDSDFRIGKGFAFGDNVMLTPYFGIGTHYWRRGPFPETYTNDYAGGGVLAQVAASNQLVFSAYGLGGGTFDSGISVATHAGVAGWSGNLGNSTTYKLGGGADYAITRNLHINAGVDYVNFDYGQSPFVNGNVEPHSTTSNVSLKAGVGYAF
jgi:opacity protein-like surface antigen